MTLRISTKANLTQRGVAAASRQKQQLLTQLSSAFKEAIQSGNAQYVAASTFYIGLAQYEYGRFVENVELPEGLTDAEQQAARTGSQQQAQQYYEAARKTWRALVAKADADDALKNDEQARRWVDRAKEAIEGRVPEDAPSASRGARPAPLGNLSGQAVRLAVVEAN